MKFIFFYTDDKIYSQHARLLQNSLEKLNLDFYSEKVSSSEWQKIIAYKPKFILEMRKKFRGKLIYIDADAFVHSYPKLFDEINSEDLAVHFFRGDELVSSTMLLNDNPETLKMLELWVSKMEKTPEIWDQKILQKVIEENKFNIYKLPPEYTFIISLSDKEYPDIKNPIIEQLQASREVRFQKRKIEVENRFFRKLFKLKKRVDPQTFERREKVKNLSEKFSWEFLH